MPPKKRGATGGGPKPKKPKPSSQKPPKTPKIPKTPDLVTFPADPDHWKLNLPDNHGKPQC